MLDLDHLARALRAYAATAKGQPRADVRRNLAWEIESAVLSHPEEIAAIIEAQRKHQRDAIVSMNAEAKRLGLD